MVMNPRTACALLEVRGTASIEDIQRAYKRLALKFHPDKNLPEHTQCTTEAFQLIQGAKQVLLDVRESESETKPFYVPEESPYDEEREAALAEKSRARLLLGRRSSAGGYGGRSARRGSRTPRSGAAAGVRVEGGGSFGNGDAGGHQQGVESCCEVAATAGASARISGGGDGAASFMQGARGLWKCGICSKDCMVIRDASLCANCGHPLRLHTGLNYSLCLNGQYCERFELKVRSSHCPCGHAREEHSCVFFRDRNSSAGAATTAATTTPREVRLVPVAVTPRGVVTTPRSTAGGSSAATTPATQRSAPATKTAPRGGASATADPEPETTEPKPNLQLELDRQHAASQKEEGREKENGPTSTRTRSSKNGGAEGKTVSAFARTCRHNHKDREKEPQLSAGSENPRRRDESSGKHLQANKTNVDAVSPAAAQPHTHPMRTGGQQARRGGSAITRAALARGETGAPTTPRQPAPGPGCDTILVGRGRGTSTSRSSSKTSTPSRGGHGPVPARLEDPQTSCANTTSSDLLIREAASALKPAKSFLASIFFDESAAKRARNERKLEEAAEADEVENDAPADEVSPDKKADASASCSFTPGTASKASSRGRKSRDVGQIKFHRLMAKYDLKL